MKQLSALDATLLRGFVENKTGTIIQILKTVEGIAGSTLLQEHVMPYRNIETQEDIVVAGLATTVDNWVRLGLVEVSYLRHFTAAHLYDWVELRPEYIEEKQKLTPREKLEIIKGSIRSTAFGEQFGRAVGIL